MSTTSKDGCWGLVQVYTGNGKGKTTAAIGLAMRAAGWGKRVLIIQFLKGRDTGELHSLARLSPLVKVIQAGSGEFCQPGERPPGLAEATERALGLAETALASGEYELVILDEILVAVSAGLAPLERVLKLVRHKPKSVELVLTGRGAPPELEAEAHLVTYMTEVKHPFRCGVEARRGVDY
jgi:cob(I)alamin adenosyltransferase